MKVDLTEEEIRIIDNEMYVAQRKLVHLNLECVDQITPSPEELRYKAIVGSLRVKFGKILERCAVGRFIA